MTWEEICQDKRFEDAPFKIETNAQGQIIMSPTNNYHGFFTYKIAPLLEKHLERGEVIVGLAVLTTDGTKEADVAWLSDERWAEVAEDISCKIAPEICVEVLSPSNSVKGMLYKRELYLSAGASENWLWDRDGKMRFFQADGELPRSRMTPELPKK